MVLIIELLILIIALQILPFLIYGIDKLFAKLGFFRIPEKALLILANIPNSSAVDYSNSTFAFFVPMVVI